MNESTLFIVGQVSTFEFLYPLLCRWVQASQRPFFVIATPVVHHYVSLSKKKLPFKLLDSLKMHELFQKQAFDCVISSASNNPVESTALAFCKREKIPTALIIDTWYGFKKRITYDGQIFLPEALWVLDSFAKQQAVVEGIPEGIITVTGNPAWENIVPPESSQTKPSYIFVEQPIRKYYGDRLGFDEQSCWLDVYDILSSTREDCQIIYAKHPDASTYSIARQADVQVVNDGINYLPSATCVIGMFSSLMVNALLYERKVISYQPGKEKPIPVIGDTTCYQSCDSKASFQHALSAPPQNVSSFKMSLLDSLYRTDKAIANLCRRKKELPHSYET